MSFEKLIKLRYALAQKDLSVFTQQAWKVLEPMAQLKWNWHHSYISEHLEACKLRQIKRLIINVAPRSTKSILASVCFPDWIWCDEKTAHERFLFGSYADSLAITQSVLRRNLLESDWYQEGFGNQFTLSSDVNTKSEFKNDKTGHMKCAGIRGAVTGEGANYIVIDDPHNPKGAESEVERESTLQNFDLSWSTRLNNKQEDVIIIIMQRLHERDLTGHLLAKNSGYVHLKIPSICEERTKIVFPMSGKEFIREEGALMHPERDGQKELDQAMLDMGSYGFAGQHQQNPVPRGGGIIKEDWFVIHKSDVNWPTEKELTTVIQSWDFAVKEKQENDFSVGLVLGRRGADKFILDMAHFKKEFPGQQQALLDLSIKWKKSYKKLIEAKANGPAIIASLKKVVPGLIEVEPDGDKVARMNAISPDVEAGNVHLPDPDLHPWVRKFLDEVTRFPKGQHDDICDAFSQGIAELRKATILALPISGHGSGVVHK